MTITVGSLFAGIGGLDLGLERAGMECHWQVEIDDYCRKVLAKHWPDVRRFADVRECGKHNLEPVDLICGGFPCQDVSLAGKRKGLKGKRTTLWSEFYRIICEIEPRWIVAENVPGLLSSDAGRFLGNILRDLAEGGYDATWDCIPAQAVGAPHERDRFFLIAHATSDGSYQSDQLLRILSQKPRAQSWSRDRRVATSRLVRIPDELPHRVDRLRALGNAVVPQVAEWIGRRIMETEATA